MAQFVYKCEQPFELESGKSLLEVEIAYTTFGTLNADKSNVVWICHAFSANSDPSEWWPGMVGEGKYFDPKTYFIVCANILGSCYGTTGPLSINPATKQPYYGDFPVITIRDIVKGLDLVRVHLKIEKIYFGLGFSMGGQQLLEWVIEKQSCFENILLGATNIKHSPWGIAFNESQRLAIEADSTFGNPSSDAGKAGMMAARSIGLISYRNYQAYCKTQPEPSNDNFDDFKASSYQKYQGEKLAKRFNAYTYWILSKAMDSHNILRKRSNNPSDVLSQIKVNTMVLGINSDYLFPLTEQKVLAYNIPGSQFITIDSEFGHDGFLLEFEQIKIVLDDFLK